jgi:hypothetical protein
LRPSQWGQFRPSFSQVVADDPRKPLLVLSQHRARPIATEILGEDLTAALADATPADRTSRATASSLRARDTSLLRRRQSASEKHDVLVADAACPGGGALRPPATRDSPSMARRSPSFEQ